MNALAITTMQPSDIYADASAFEHAQRVAKVFGSSTLVPEHLRKNPADALVALGIARALGEQPLVVMQNIYFVSGRAGWSTKYKIARANRAGVFRGPIRWRSEGAGETLCVTAYADLIGVEGDSRIEVAVDMKLAKAEGWTKNAKYQSMPEHMLRWRSASMLIDLYCPDVMLGLPTLEEIETMPDVRGGDGAVVIDFSGDAQIDRSQPALFAPTPPQPPETPTTAATSPSTPAAVAGPAGREHPPRADAGPALPPPAGDEPSRLEMEIAGMILDAGSAKEIEALADLFRDDLAALDAKSRERITNQIAEAARKRRAA